MSEGIETETAAIGDEPRHPASVTVESIERLIERAESAERDLDGHRREIAGLDAELKEHEEEISTYYGAETRRLKLRGLLDYYRNAGANSIASAKHLRDEIVIELRALAIVAEMAGNGSTHHEKNARLRGLTEIIEGAIERLHNITFDAVRDHLWARESLFRSDYPTRHYVAEIQRLQSDVKRLQAKLDGKEPEIEF